MKLPIKKKYFDQIKSGHKTIEWRDAHITFICEETGEMLTKKVIFCKVMEGIREEYPDVLEDEKSIGFSLQ